MYEQNSFEPVARVVQLASHIEQKRLADIAYETRRFVRIGESEETINQRIQDKSQPLINVYHYHCNHLGTPQELTNQDGDVIWLSYDRAWGGSFETIYKQQFIDNFAIIENELQPIKFQGQSLDTETGLHYNRFRYYDSDVGMFISRDPIELLGGFNVFAYAPNPVGWIDPWGLYSDLNHDGMGHHLMPRSIAKALGIDDLSQKKSIAWYPNSPTDTAKLHGDLHSSLSKGGIPFHGSKYTGTAEEFFKVAKEAYKDFTAVGFMKIPYTDKKLFKNLTPLQAIEKLEELYKTNKIPKPNCTGA